MKSENPDEHFIGGANVSEINTPPPLPDTQLPPASSEALFTLPPLESPSSESRPPATPPSIPPISQEAASEKPKLASVPSSVTQKQNVNLLIGLLVFLLVVAAVMAFYSFKRESNEATPQKQEPVQEVVSAPVAEPEPIPVAPLKSEVVAEPAPAPPPQQTEKAPDPVPEVVSAQKVAPVAVPAPSSQPVQARQKKKQLKPADAEGPIQLEGSFYLFGDSIRESGIGYRRAFTVLNSGVSADDPLAGQVKSQVLRVIVNCQNSTWGYDQRLYYSLPFGDGERLAERIWRFEEVKFKPFRASLQDERLKSLACE